MGRFVGVCRFQEWRRKERMCDNAPSIRDASHLAVLRANMLQMVEGHGSTALSLIVTSPLRDSALGQALRVY